jgi:hypothetical protein
VIAEDAGLSEWSRVKKVADMLLDSVTNERLPLADGTVPPPVQALPATPYSPLRTMTNGGREAGLGECSLDKGDSKEGLDAFPHQLVSSEKKENSFDPSMAPITEKNPEPLGPSVKAEVVLPTPAPAPDSIPPADWAMETAVGGHVHVPVEKAVVNGALDDTYTHVPEFGAMDNERKLIGS